MPRFAANMSMMFNELPFLDRFAAARAAGFEAVEFLFPYEFPAAEIAKRLADNGLANRCCSTPHPATGRMGERGTACCPAGRPSSARGQAALEYAPPSPARACI
jgi:hydroxypyruvate isomerase